MTKLVVVLAVVVVVILVVVFVAVRNMRAEDPEEFADRPRGRDGDGGSRDGRDPRYDRGEPAGRQPARAGRGGPPAGSGSRSAASRDVRRDHQADGHDRRARSGRGYDGDAGSGQRRAAADRRGAPSQRGGQDRRRTGPGRTRENQPPAPARQARNRPPGDSSEWDSSEWDKLSDIDYWTELASDKSLTTTVQSAVQAPPARPARPAADRDAETAALQGSGEAAPGPRHGPARARPPAAGRRRAGR
jgi:hypothetical protein